MMKRMLKLSLLFTLMFTPVTNTVALTVNTAVKQSSTQQQPLRYTGKRVLKLAPKDKYGRAVNAHIQLSYKQQPKKDREPTISYNPVGWHNYNFYYKKGNATKRAWLMNRGHLVGYLFSGVNSDGRNLVQETAYFNAGNYSGTNSTNKNSMLYYEMKLDRWLETHKGWKLDYQVTPIYKGSEKMPRQIRLAYVGYTNKGKKVTIKLNSSKEKKGNGGATVVTLNNTSPNAKINYKLGTAVNTVKKLTVSSPSKSTSKTKTNPSTSNRKVYVTGKGTAKVYWYGTTYMPKNTNKKNVITMKEKDAYKLGKRLSKTEKIH
ncbi:MAG: DNA/RNA non-specific endonuclease [Streptococcaceae bacterium]|jgi:DNA-entry nuclease|nr:DNA/RNA non-specific endonuclease [Streptococcaceae bacterium]